MIYNSTGGGTGAGLGSLILEKLSNDYGALPKISCPVYPSDKLSSSVLEPYNSVLHTTKMLEHSSVSMCFDNGGLYNRCHNNLGIEKPSFLHMNKLLAHYISSVTTCLRNDGSLNVDLAEFETNLVPYPSISGCLTSLSPMNT
mmetsp:Transcript_30184/g.29487  ORF Transcript_30184/g.29487 Transcript_30184/m.29487 type:complete len:143 (-) Transcript_30184:540-968(-)